MKYITRVSPAALAVSFVAVCVETYMSVVIAGNGVSPYKKYAFDRSEPILTKAPQEGEFPTLMQVPKTCVSN